MSGDSLETGSDNLQEKESPVSDNPEVLDNTGEEQQAHAEEVATDVSQTPDETPKTEYEVLVDEAGGPNKYTKMLSDVADGAPQIAETPLFKALIIIAAKYGGLFDALSNLGLSFEERMSKEDYKDEKIDATDAGLLLNLQNIPTSLSEDSFNFLQKENEQIEASSTRFSAGLLFGNTDGLTFNLAERDITDPYQLAAKLDKGHFDASSNNTRPYERINNSDVFFANMNSFPSGSVVFFNLDVKESTEEKPDKGSKIPIKIEPMLSGVLDGNGNILYFGPSIDDKTPKVRRISIVDMKNKAFEINMVLKKDNTKLENIVSGNTAPATDPTPAPATTTPAPAPASAPVTPVAPADPATDPASAPVDTAGTDTGAPVNPTGTDTVTPAPSTVAPVAPTAPAPAPASAPVAPTAPAPASAPVTPVAPVTPAAPATTTPAAP